MRDKLLQGRPPLVDDSGDFILSCRVRLNPDNLPARGMAQQIIPAVFIWMVLLQGRVKVETITERLSDVFCEVGAMGRLDCAGPVPNTLVKGRIVP